MNALVILEMQGLLNYLPRLASNLCSSMSASQVARITGVSHGIHLVSSLNQNLLKAPSFIFGMASDLLLSEQLLPLAQCGSYRSSTAE
jgi:hypothetical protein